jgi:predicted DNA-binding protein with PD1-like motif
VHEAAGVGTIFPDDAGRPVLHLHAAFGRDDRAVAGCIRRGVITWIVGEAIVLELAGSTARRTHDDELGFEVLEP